MITSVVSLLTIHTAGENLKRTMKHKASLPWVATNFSSFWCYHLHLFFVLLLLLASLPFNFASTPGNNNDHYLGNCVGCPVSGDHAPHRYGVANPPSTEEEHKLIKNAEENNTGQKFSKEEEVQLGLACPLEPKAFNELKKNLAPAIRERLKELSKKAPTIESAHETAHSIDILKLLKESNLELDEIREKLHTGAQALKNAFEKIHHHI